MVRLIKKMFLGFKSVCPIVRVHDPCVQVCAPNKVKKNECKCIQFIVRGKRDKIFSLA